MEYKEVNKLGISPAPWKITGAYGHLIEKRSGSNIGAFDVIVEVWRGGNRDDNYKSNANLIAAAPDLYEIVNELVDKYSGLCGIDHDFKGRAKEALYKAKGM